MILQNRIMKKIYRFVIDVVVILLLVVLDQLSKVWAVNNLKNGDPIILIKGVLQLFYLPNGNTGAAFGILSGHQMFFFIIAAAVIIAIFIALSFIPATKKYMILRILLIMIAAGGAGNMVDRIKLNYVVDFIYFYLIDFPIFNVADCYVTVGTILLAIIVIFVYKDQDMKELENECRKLFNRNAGN